MRRWWWRTVAALFLALVLLVLLARWVGAGVPSAQVAYESRIDRSNFDLMLADIDRRLNIPLTRTPHGERHPAWHPDGTQLAFASDASGHWEIYTLSLDAPGAPPQQLTRDGVRAMYPSFSPDGTAIAFDSTRDGNFELYWMPLPVPAGPSDGAERLTFSVDADREPRYSPDGTRLLFTAYRDTDFDIHLYDLTIRRAFPLHDNRRFNEWQAGWSPDNAAIALSSTGDDDWEVHVWSVVNPETPPRQLTNLPDDAAGPVWSPDGAWIVFEMYDTPRTRSLYRVRANAERAGLDALQRLTFTNTDDRFAAWRPRK